MLKYLVPWGDAVFNQAQADDLAFDIAELERANPDPQLLEILNRLEPLAVDTIVRKARQVGVRGAVLESH